MLIKSHIAKIQGNEKWINLNKKHIFNENIHISHCIDIHPNELPVSPIFYRAKKVFITDCDKNFVYYWLHRSLFPSCKEFYLTSHPCEPEVFYRFKSYEIVNSLPILYLSDSLKSYKRRWAENISNIVVKPDSWITEQLNEFEEEPLNSIRI